MEVGDLDKITASASSNHELSEERTVMTTKPPDWVKDAVFYQIFPDRFAKSDLFGRNGYPTKAENLQPWGAPPTHHGFQGGDLLGVLEKLDYIVDLGINAIYLNPIFSSASNHRYHTFDYYNVDPLLGGNKAFKSFLDAAHKRNIRVILDGVFNHASRGFFQFNHLMECGSESPYIDWFHIHGWPVNAFDLQHQPNYDAWWGMHSLPKFNTHNPAVREFLWDVATHWLRQDIDGWRLDVPNEIDDDAFWQEFRHRCKAINPEMYIVGEFWGEAHRWLGGDQFDGQMNYLITRAVLGFFTNNNIDQTDTVHTGYGYIQPLNGHQFAAELERIHNRLYQQPIVFSQMNMLGSHDTPRTMTIARKDSNSVALMYLCLMTIPGAPNIYYGDEIGLEGGRDPQCRRAFPWKRPELWNNDLRLKIKKYIQLRHKFHVLRRGDFKILYANDHLVVYQREYLGQTAVIALNSSHRPQAYHCPQDFPKQLAEQFPGTGRPLQPGTKVSIHSQTGRVWIEPNLSP
jgi:neopullulanase